MQNTQSGKVYVADTNNHAVRVADLESREVATLELDWGVLEPLTLPQRSQRSRRNSA